MRELEIHRSSDAYDYGEFKLPLCLYTYELVLDKSENLSPPCLYVVVPSLQGLSIIDKCDGNDDSKTKVVINAPSLKYLDIVDKFASGLSCLTEDMPEIVEAIVNVVYKSPEKPMRSLTSVKRLSLCLSTSMVSKENKKTIVFSCDPKYAIALIIHACLCFL